MARRGLSRDDFNLVIAAMALILSLALGAGDWIERIRGSDIEVSKPYQVLFYTDGPTLESSIVWIGLEISLVNQSRFGDSAVLSDLTFGTRDESDGVVFRAEAQIMPIFTLETDEKISCADMTRCRRLTDFVIGETPIAGIDLPGGGAQNRFLGFPITSSSCQSIDGLCGKFMGTRLALAEMGRRQHNVLELRIHTVGDGIKRATCSLPDSHSKAWSDFARTLRRDGWAVLNCR